MSEFFGSLPINDPWVPYHKLLAEQDDVPCRLEAMQYAREHLPEEYEAVEAGRAKLWTVQNKKGKEKVGMVLLKQYIEIEDRIILLYLEATNGGGRGKRRGPRRPKSAGSSRD